MLKAKKSIYNIFEYPFYNTKVSNYRKLTKKHLFRCRRTMPSSHSKGIRRILREKGDGIGHGFGRLPTCTAWAETYHLVIQHSHGESPIHGGFNGKIIYKWQFSMAMSNNQKVSGWWLSLTLWKILVTWDYDSQYMAKYNMFQTTNQYCVRPEVVFNTFDMVNANQGLRNGTPGSISVRYLVTLVLATREQK